MLAYLALEASRAHARDALAALFWPDDSEQAAKQNLRQALYQLRQLLGESSHAESEATSFLHVTRDTVQFNRASDYTLDVATFLDHLERQRLEDAVQVYNDDLLVGLNSDSEPFEEWLALTRESLHLRALDALDQLTCQALERADFTHAQRYARRQLELEPWREEAHRQLMRALAAAGERSAALVQFEHCRRILADELGVEPDDETRALAEHIRMGKLVKEMGRRRDKSNEVSSPAHPFPSLIGVRIGVKRPTAPSFMDVMPNKPNWIGSSSWNAAALCWCWAWAAWARHR